jgi:hypothetical protein
MLNDRLDGWNRVAGQGPHNQWLGGEHILHLKGYRYVAGRKDIPEVHRLTAQHAGKVLKDRPVVL